MKRTKIIVSMAVASLALLGTYTTASADVGAYAVKDAKTNVIRQYNLESLTEAFLNNKLGQGNDLLLKDFKEDQGKNGVHAIYDDSKKYVDFEEAVKGLEETKVSGKEFDLNTFLKDAKATEFPNYVYERKVKEDKVINSVNVTKEGLQLDLAKENFEEYEDLKVVATKVIITNGTVKGKFIVDCGDGNLVTVKNLKVDDIAGLSGVLKLEGVVAKNLVIENSMNLNLDAASQVSKIIIAADKGEEVVLSGNLGTVELTTPTKVVVSEGTKVQITVSDAAKDATIVAESGAQVTTDKPVANVEGPGTVTTNPGTSTGGGGGSYIPGPTVDHSALDAAIAGIFAKANLLDDTFNNNLGYFGYSKVGNTITVTVPDKTSQQLYTSIKNDGKSVANVLASGAYTNLRNAILSANVNTQQLIAAFKSNIDGLEIAGLEYNDGLSFIQNLVRVLNYEDKAAFNEKAIEISNIPEIKIGNYKVTSITLGNKQIYSNTTNKITKADVKEALGVTGQTYANIMGTNLKTLLNKNVVITLQDANGNSTPYTIVFN